MNGKNVKLTSAELIVMLNENSAKIFPVGIENPFAGLGKINQTKLELEVEDSLNEKGIRTRRFGGRFKYSAEALELIKILTEFSKCVDVSIRLHRNNHVIHNSYYLYDGEWTELSENDAESVYEVNRSKPEDIQAIMKRLPSDVCNADYFIKMRKLDLKKAVRLIECGKMTEEAELLKQTGAGKESIELMHRALLQETDFTTLTLISNEEGCLNTDSSAIITSNGDSVELFTEVASDDRTMVGFKNAETGTYLKLLEVLHQWLTA